MNKTTTIVFASLFLTPLVSSSCPNLSGKWICQYSSKEISQEVVSGSTLYTFKEDAQTWNLLADGKIRTIPTESGNLAEFQGRCLNEKALSYKIHLKDSHSEWTQETVTTPVSDKVMTEDLKWTSIENGKPSSGGLVTTCSKQ